MNLVFAHFGSPLPKHLILNLKRCVMLFPSNQVYLVTDLNPNKNRINKVIIYSFQHTPEWKTLDNTLKHAKAFRNNFWFTSTARFLALADFSNFTKDEFLHIESDVILSEDFPFMKLSKSNHNFLFPVVSDSNAIASCLYIKDSISANYLANFTLIESQKNNLTTDMYILSELSKKVDIKFSPLPTAPSIYYLNTKLNDRFLKMSDVALTDFGGVFDGFDIGRYLFGDDPRNRRGFSVLRDNDSLTYLDIRNLDLVTKSERDFPYIWNQALDSYTPIYSLHIHSKNLKLFKINKSKKTIYKYVSKSKERPKQVFIFKVFLKSAIKAFQTRTNNLISDIIKS